MNAKAESLGAKFDLLKWLFIVILLGIGVVASTYYAEQPVLYHFIGWLIGSCGVVFIAFQTAQGKAIWAFLQEARVELRKVVWPTRQETLQTTLVVILMVVITALFLWGIDTLLLWLVSLLTGSRG